MCFSSSNDLAVIPTTPNLSGFALAIYPLIQTHRRSFLGNIRPRSRRSAPPDKLRCVFAPFGRGYHSAPVLSRALPSATSAWQCPMTAPPPCGTGQTSGQRGAAALRPARNGVFLGLNTRKKPKNPTITCRLSPFSAFRRQSKTRNFRFFGVFTCL